MVCFTSQLYLLPQQHMELVKNVVADDIDAQLASLFLWCPRVSSHTSTTRPRYHCLHFQIVHAIYSQFNSLTSC